MALPRYINIPLVTPTFYFTCTIFILALHIHTKRDTAQMQSIIAAISKMASWMTMINNDAIIQRDALLQRELLNFAHLERLKHDYTATLCYVYYIAVYFPLVVSAIMWAGVQRKLLLQLTPLTYDSTRSEYRRAIFKLTNLLLLVYLLLYLSMYFSFVERDILFGLQSMQAIIFYIPLLIPRTFYFNWPIMSRGFLMFWAQVWLQDIHLWLLGMISRFQYLCSEADVHSLIQVSSSASSPCSVCWCTGYAASGLSDGNASTQCSDMTWILVSMQQSTIFL